MVGKSINTMACCVKLLVANELAHRLEELYPVALQAARHMLRDRLKSSSKHWKELPCVVAKSLITKYQRNLRCKKISRIVIPVCGDKGKQIKLESSGIRIPALFGKSVLPVVWLKQPIGFVRSVEFYKRAGRWFGSICINIARLSPINPTGVVGLDRNSVGNIAVMADHNTGKVLKFGICPARTKVAMRGRRKNLQKAGKFRLLSKLRHKQRRRMTHENHRASKSVVDYAAKHCRAVAIENLKSVSSSDSAIRCYSEKNQWAYAQLGTFLHYKCALRGVPIIEVDPAWTSQTCSRCGSRHKPIGKLFSCSNCGRTAHRDVNAAFVIAQRSLACIGGGSGGHDVLPLRRIGDAQTGKDGAK